MSGATTLFDVGPGIPIERVARTELAPNALVRRPMRDQFEIPVMTLDERIATDHPVRAIVALVDGLDLRAIELEIDSNTVQGGRPAIDPRILLSLWVWGTSRGESMASEIARRAQSDDVYRWICGNVPVGERKLADFRASRGAVFASVLTQVIGALMSEKLIELHRLAQDGMRVRAWSGADSFRRAQTLEGLLEEARTHVNAVLAESNDPKRSLVAKAAAERGAKDRVARIERALARAKTLSEAKSEEELADKKNAPRASTTDAEATRMKMGDGGFRPAYNVQFATCADGTGAIVGVSVTNRGNDFGEIEPMLAQVEERTDVRPAEMLVDGGYLKQEDIESVEKKGTAVYAPDPKKKAAPASATVRDRSAELTTFYGRIESPEGKAIYAHRGQVAELANAHARSRFGLSVLLVRGLQGALTIATLVAVTNNATILIRERARRDTRLAISEETREPTPADGA